MTTIIYIEPSPSDGRHYLVNQDGKRVGNTKGYLTLGKAKSARHFLIQGREAIRATYKYKSEMGNELKHFSSL